jgi:hypothetical protein
MSAGNVRKKMGSYKWSKYDPGRGLTCPGLVSSVCNPMSPDQKDFMYPIESAT